MPFVFPVGNLGYGRSHLLVCGLEWELLVNVRTSKRLSKGWHRFLNFISSQKSSSPEPERKNKEPNDDTHEARCNGVVLTAVIVRMVWYI